MSENKTKKNKAQERFEREAKALRKNLEKRKKQKKLRQQEKDNPQNNSD